MRRFLPDGTRWLPRCRWWWLAGCLAALPAAAQTTVTTLDAMGHRVQAVYPAGTQMARLMDHGRPVAERIRDADDEVAVVVEFRAPPAAKGLTAGHTRFRAAVAALDAAPPPGRAPARTRIRRTYTRALNGMALTTRQWVADRLAALPGVRRVVPDVRVQAADTVTNALLGVDRVRAETGLTGAGVRLAVIDSGIDYTHPDLGGGFGPGFRVEGGYDFVHDDPDPMDDFGHGTHVAGIAAGSGAEAPGVAPGVRLLAYKVLDERGFGRASDIIAAIERAMDPDGDPATDDAADVINLSLGAEGNAADPVSTAVDNAVAAGIVCVVAAGNDGGYQTIGSPAAARGALTVGATDNDDRLALFSSRGPTTGTFDVKPELVAPGVQVNAPWPGGGLARLSGTSMAAPHVAGAVALLLERHPGWTPGHVKSVLVQTARDLGADVWTQGGGRLDVAAAVAATAYVRPARIHFGVVDPDEALWQRAETLTLVNEAAAPQAFTLTPALATAGVTATVSPGHVTLAPGDSAAVTLTLTVDNAAVPFSGVPPPVAGVLHAEGEADTLRVPFVVIKAHQLAFSFDATPLLAAVYRPGVTATLLPGLDDALLLDPGMYTVMALFQDDAAGRRTVVVREGVVVSGRTELTLSTAEAVHTITFAPRGADGQPLTPEADVDLLEQRSTGFSLLLLNDPLYTELRTNTLSDDFVLHHLVLDYDDPSGADYRVPFRLDGVAASSILENDPAALRRIDYAYAAGAGGAFVDVAVGNDRTEIGFFDATTGARRLPDPPARTYFVAPNPAEGFAFPAFFQEVYDGPAPDLSGHDNLLYETATLEVTTGPVNVYRRFGGTPVAVREEAAIRQDVGTGPPFWTGDILQFVGDRIYLAPAPFFVNPGFDTRNAAITWTLFDTREGLVAEDDGRVDNNRFSSLPGNILFDPGPHELVWTFAGYAVDGLDGHATARQVFDSARQTREPANLQRLELTSDGTATDVLVPGADNRLRFDAQFEGLAAGVAVRRVGAQDWAALPVTALSGAAFEVALPDTLAPGYHALRITLEDADESRFEYTVDPAFRWGVKDVAANRAPGAFRLVAPAPGAEVDPADSLRLAWTAAADPDAGDVVRYVVHVAGPGVDTTRTVRLDTTLTLALPLASGAAYDWSVQATDGLAVVEGGETTFQTARAVAVDAGPPPATFALLPAYPNPSQGAVTLAFVLPAPARVDLRVYDVLGREVAVPARGRFPAGTHRVRWDAPALPAGVYVYRLRAGVFTASGRLVRLR